MDTQLCLNPLLCALPSLAKVSALQLMVICVLRKMPGTFLSGAVDVRNNHVRTNLAAISLGNDFVGTAN